jgi:hypothetical protein
VLIDHSFLSALEGLPKSLRDRDIDVEMPSDVDDDFVTADEYLLSLPGEPTGMLLFVSLIKLVRILSKTLEILYTTTERRQVVTKIESIDRLLDEWLHNLPGHLHLGRAVPEQLSSSAQGTDRTIAFLRLTYLYTRFVAHRVTISFQSQAVQYWTSLATCVALAKEIIWLNSQCQDHLLIFDVNPGLHVYTLWTCGLMVLYGLMEFKTKGEGDFDSAASSESKLAAETCLKLLMSLVAAGRRGEQVRVNNLTEIMTAIFSNQTSSGMETTESFCRFLPRKSVTGFSLSARSSHPPSEEQSAIPGRTFNQPFRPASTDQNEDWTNSGLGYQPIAATARVNPNHSPEPVRSEMAIQSPPLIGDFSIDYSNASLQPPMPSTGYTSEQGSITAAQSLDDVSQIWDDPLFDLTSMITAVSTGSNASFADADITSFSVPPEDGRSSRKRMREDTSS